MAATPALAQGPYGGAGIGLIDTRKVFVGFEPVDRLAVELAYERTLEALDFLFGRSRAVEGVQYSLLGFLPLGRNSLYGRVGRFSWDAIDETGKKVGSGTDFSIGIGYQFDSTGNWRTRIELEHSGDTGGSFLTVSFGYRFSASR